MLIFTSYPELENNRRTVEKSFLLNVSKYNIPVKKGLRNSNPSFFRLFALLKLVEDVKVDLK